MLRNTSDLHLSRRRLLRGAGLLAATAPFGAHALAAQAAPGPIDDEAKLRARIAEQFGRGGAAAAQLEKLAAEDRLSGVVGVALGDELLFSQAYGLADRDKQVPIRIDTRFNLASMNKMFTAVAIARLAERGRLSWQDRVTRHVADLPEALADITIDHLLTHRSGLGSYFGSPLFAEKVGPQGRTISDYMEIVRQDRPRFTPGETYEYSNNGYVLLGAVIERLTGTDYFSAVDKLVYRPAGMRRTAHLTLDERGPDTARGYTTGCFARPPSQCTPHAPEEAIGALRGTPAGGGYSTLPDLLRFSTALRAGKLVRPDTLQLMTRRHVDIARPGGPIDGYGYGFGLLRINGRESFGHNGGTIGGSSQLDMLAPGSLSIIVLTNTDGAQRSASSILRRAVLPSG